MPGPFTITPSSTLITLEDNRRQGTAAFTVKNDTTRRINATARLVIPNGSPAGTWLTILKPGDPNEAPELPGTVRTFDLGETETYVVKIAAPSDAVPAAHTFRLVIADEVNPDDSFTESADISVVLNRPPDLPPPPKFPIWVIPVALVILVLVIIIIVLLTRNTEPPLATLPAEQLENLSPLFGETLVFDALFLNSDPIDVQSFSILNAERELTGVDFFGNACTGFISVQPTFLIRVQERPSQFVTFFFQSETQDTTLAIRDSNGNVFCNDDAQDVQPAVEIAVGIQEYRIWVGSKQADQAVNGTLILTSNCQNIFDC